MLNKFIENNEEYQSLYKEITDRMEKSIIKIGDIDMKTSEYYQLEERRNNLLRDECFGLKWQLDNFNNNVLLQKYYEIEVDDEDCSNNDKLD